MQITKREFLERLGILGVAGLGGSAFGDEYVPDRSRLPPGSCGDPDNVWFGKNIFPLPHTIEDGPSCFMKNGKVFEPAKEIPVFHETDVVVVGGGPAGFSAAIAAARAGARVALVEAAGSLGGLFTNGMVLIMLSSSRREESGDWTLVTRGLCEEFMNRAEQLGAYACSGRGGKNGAGSGRSEHRQPTVDPEAAKYLMDTMIGESKVEMFFHAMGVDVIQNGEKVLGIVFESKQGRQAILARQVVDCTGDADMLFKAGGDYRQITHGIGHVVRLANMDRITATMPPRGADGRPLPGKWPIRGNEGNPSTWWGNTGTGPKGNGLDIRDLSAAEIAFRKEWWNHVAKMRATPGWEEVFIANTCSMIGPRCTRLVNCDMVLGRRDIAEGYDKSEPLGWFGQDGVHAAFPVPFKCILPRKVDNLLVAGRCLGTGDTCDTFRLICPCFVTGQAAGAAAALAAKSGVSPRSLAYSAVRAELIRQNVYI